MKRIFIGFFFLVALQCALSSPASAQSTLSPLCILTRGWWFILDGTPPAGWAFYSSYPGTFVTVLFAGAASCPPPAAPAETCASCARATAASPINLASGNTFIDETDVKLPGLGGGLTLSRRWNSLWPATQSAYQIGMFGPNWTSNYTEQIFVGSDNYIKYEKGDGSFWSFGVSAYNLDVWTVAAPANESATLVQGTSYWTLTFKSGEQRLFSVSTGKLVSIIDRNGNTTQLSYDSLNQLTTVTDPASRHLYFNRGSTYLVTSVTSDFGVTVSYSYDTSGRLSQVTEPDSSTLTFTYDSNSFITAVLDANSKTIEAHTYDSGGRGLTASRAGGVDAVTISY